MRVKLNDPSPRTGLYEGDLAYGRCLRDAEVKNRDYEAIRDQSGKASNQPCMRLVLVEPRDPKVWKKSSKKVDGVISNSQGFQNKVLLAFCNNLRYLRGNFHVKIGKSRFSV